MDPTARIEGQWSYDRTKAHGSYGLQEAHQSDPYSIARTPEDPLIQDSLNDAQDNQVITPRLTPEEDLERRAAKVASKLSTKDHLMTNVLGSLRKG